VLSNYWAWQETALLLALLTQNPHLSVMACESALHHDRTEALTAVLSDYRPRVLVDGLGASPNSMERNHFPNSIWLETR